MPALALTDLANAFGLVKFYRAARAARHQADRRLRRLDHARGRARPAVPRAAARAVARRLPAARRLAVARVSHATSIAAARSCGATGSHEGTDGLIALSGARDGDVGSALAAGQRRRRGEGGARVGERSFRSATTSKCSARAAPTTTRWSPRPCGSPRELALPVVATHPVQFLRREDFRAHEARVCIAEGHVLADPRRPRRFTPEQYFKTQAEMAAAFADLPEALANSRRDRAALQPHDSARQEPPARFSDAAGRHARRAPARRSGGRARAAARRALSGSRGARREARRVRRAPRLRDDDHRADGLRRLLPDRRRLHQLGEAQRRAGRPGPRLGRGLARRVLARHHRSRSAALRRCCSSASSIPSACRCRTSTSTSARTAATA